MILDRFFTKIITCMMLAVLIPYCLHLKKFISNHRLYIERISKKTFN